MKRRNFIKSMGAVGASALLPSTWPTAFSMSSMYRAANAAVDYAGAQISAPAIMPQVINIFLYGGPSELSGNLTNIVDIDTNSQNSYVTAFGPGILTNDDDGTGDNGLITPNGFWRGAGGLDMQFLLNGNGSPNDNHMSVYRTLMKSKDGTRSHRESILMSLKGSLDIENSAGVGTRIAATLYQNRASFEGTTTFADGTDVNMDNMILPFVSFEGDTRAFATDPDYAVPLLLRGTTLNEDLQDPYNRTPNTDGNSVKLDAMVSKKLADPVYSSRFAKVISSDGLRQYLASRIGSIKTAAGILPTISDTTDQGELGLVDAVTPMSYPENNRYSDRIEAAITLAIENPSSLYITVGGGLGGWDDHNNGIDNYPNRMNQLFAALKAAALHIKYSGIQTAGVTGTPGGGLNRRTDNIVINVFGDFGRRVNLNNSEGWDHGNNQNLWTIGGAGVVSAANGGAARQLGKVVGRTERVGTPGTNNQVTEPVADSYKFEPMSIASSVYSYFGVQNPEILTADPDLNPAGDPAIDETAAGEPALF